MRGRRKHSKQSDSAVPSVYTRLHMRKQRSEQYDAEMRARTIASIYPQVEGSVQGESNLTEDPGIYPTNNIYIYI